MPSRKEHNLQHTGFRNRLLDHMEERDHQEQTRADQGRPPALTSYSFPEMDSRATDSSSSFILESAARTNLSNVKIPVDACLDVVHI